MVGEGITLSYPAFVQGKNCQEWLEWLSIALQAQLHAVCWQIQRRGQDALPEGTLCLKDSSGWENRAQDPELWVLCSRRNCPVVKSCVTLVGPCP